jgi:hypothetical protein
VVYTESDKQLRMPDNFNEIVKIASGEYFTILSDDDILQPDFLKEFDLLTQKYPAVDVLHCRVRIVDQEGNMVGYSELCPEFEALPDFMFHRLIGSRLFFLSDFVVSTRALKAIGGFPTQSNGWGLDSVTWHLLGGNGIAYSPRLLFDYRVNTANFTNNAGNLILKLEDLVFLRNELKNIIQSELFRKTSVYPEAFLLAKSDERFQNDAEEVLAEISRANNFFRFYRFYKKYKGVYGFRKKTLLKLTLKKLFL